MALTAGQINVGNYPQPDYSGVVRSAQSAAAQGAEGISKAVGQVTDYFKQQGDKKKLIKQSDSQIDAALKLFPELSPALQGVRDRMRDENISLDERAMLATNSQDSITNALNIMKTKTSMELAREREGRMTSQPAVGGTKPLGQ
jgi:hypothetical protein